MSKIFFLSLLFSLLLDASSLKNVAIGIKSTQYDYTEVDVDQTILDTEQSSFSDLFGLYANLHFELKEEKLEFLNALTTGNTRYVGSLLSGGGYGSYNSITSNTFFKSELALVKKIERIKNYKVFVLPAFGYHYWERTLSASQNEIYSWFYYQLALRTQFRLKDDSGICLQYSHMWALSPTMYADIPSLGIDDDFDLGRTEGDYLMLLLHRNGEDGHDLEFKVEFEVVDIGRSNVIKGFVEPQSRQKNLHLSVGLIFNPFD